MLDSRLPKKSCFISFSENPLKTHFLFHLKSLICSQDISIFVLTFSHVEENGSKLMSAWLTNNYITHVAQYLTRWRQPDNEIRSDTLTKLIFMWTPICRCQNQFFFWWIYFRIWSNFSNFAWINFRNWQDLYLKKKIICV